jgi:hypothetical protein
MLNFTITWVLRTAGLRLLGGLAAMILGPRGLSAYYVVEGLERQNPVSGVTPVTMLLGPWPFLIACVAGVVLVIGAWREGRNARHAHTPSFAERVAVFAASVLVGVGYASAFALNMHVH